MKKYGASLIRAHALALGAMTLLAFTARAEQDSTSPIAVLAIDSGHQVSFFEPFPGDLVVVERRQHWQHSVVHQDLQESGGPEIFRQLSAGREVPEALIAAHQRGLNRLSEPEAHALIPAGDSPHPASDGMLSLQHATDQGSHFSGEFDNAGNHGLCERQPADVHATCLTNKTGDWYSANVSAHGVAFRAGVYRGWLTWTVTYNNQQLYQGVVSPGEILRLSHLAKPYGTMAKYRSHFTGAAGDGWHFAGRWIDVRRIQ